MEEELLKRNTDCVYFLASPFTCKKGAECEYRHSDMARLNPRDCWYWLSGNCLNLTCAFRHPPLDAQIEPTTETAAKTTVPCFFYYNGFCNKGNRCPFLHEPNGNSTWKPKTSNATLEAPVPPSDTKISARTDKDLTPANKPPSPSEMAMTQQAQSSDKNNTPELNKPMEPYIPEYEETTDVKDLIKSESEPSLGSDQCSEELIDGNIVRDEWWESSPGFDVLVEGKTQDTAYEDEDLGYSHAMEGNDRDHECLLSQQGYVDQIDYDESGFLENGLYEVSEHLDDDGGRYSPKLGRGFRKRKFLPVELPVGGHNVDLRDYLRKRRMVDGYLDDFAHTREERQRRVQRHHPINQTLPRRISSKVERNGVGLTRKNPRNSRHNGSRQYNPIRRHQYSTDGQWRSFSKREIYTREYSTFGGRKSRPEIKEARMRHPGKNGAVDFEGPKPLSEILKDKRKTSSGSGNINSTS